MYGELKGMANKPIWACAHIRHTTLSSSKLFTIFQNKLLSTHCSVMSDSYWLKTPKTSLKSELKTRWKSYIGYRSIVWWHQSKAILQNAHDCNTSFFHLQYQNVHMTYSITCHWIFRYMCIFYCLLIINPRRSFRTRLIAIIEC